MGGSERSAGATEPGRGTCGVTVVACGSAGCPHTAAGCAGAGEALRHTVRHTAHGMLVRVDCLLGDCCASVPPGGRHVLVQPCDHDRRPVGPVALLGPLHEPADVDEVCAHLAHAGDPVPAHLVAGVVTRPDPPASRTPGT